MFCGNVGGVMCVFGVLCGASGWVCLCGLSIYLSIRDCEGGVEGNEAVREG